MDKPFDPQKKEPSQQGPFNGPKKGPFKGPKKGPFKGGKKGPFKGLKKGLKKRNREKLANAEAIKELIETYKISFGLALNVCTHKLTLEDALKQQKINEEIRAQASVICEEYKEISFSAAFRIVKENVSPEEYLAKKQKKKEKLLEIELKKKMRMQQDEQQKSAYQKLEEYVKEETLLELAEYKGKLIKGKIRDFTPYTFNFIEEEKENIIHRLHLKYFYEQEHSAIIQKWIIIDKAIQKKQLKPKYKPIDRFQFPEGVLQKGAEIMLALHEGEMIRGIIEWFTPYDIMMKINGKFSLWIFRHSVIECALLNKVIK